MLPLRVGASLGVVGTPGKEDRDTTEGVAQLVRRQIQCCHEQHEIISAL